MSSTDVLIIGAGAAGVAAARALTRSGLSVTILEARERIGGRIHTIRDPLYPIPVDLGAEFIHGRPPEIFRDVESGRLPAYEIMGSHVFVDNGRVKQTNWDETEAILSGMADAPEQSFREYVETRGASPEARRAAAGFIEGFNAARQERISVQSLALGEAASKQIEGDRNFRIAGGYDKLVESMWKEIDASRREIFLGMRVEQIAWKRGDVRVAAAGRQFQAGRAIVTLPLGVLQAGSVRFDPEPAILQPALEALEMGSAARIVMRFRRPFWEDNEELRHAAFLHGDDPWMPVWWTALPMRAPLITGWSGGPRAESAQSDPADWVARSLESLGRLLGRPATELEPELQSWRAHNWLSDPYSCGAYSYVRVGGVAAQRRFGEPVEDTLYFAGEAVNSDGHIGTVHGAIASGERAANSIVYH